MAEPGEKIPEHKRRLIRKTSPRRLAQDRFAALLVRLGGAVVISGILGILLFLFVESAPLFFPGKVETIRAVSLQGAKALSIDPYGSWGLSLDAEGVLHLFSWENGKEIKSFQLFPGLKKKGKPILLSSSSTSFTLEVGKGKIAERSFRWDVSFDPKGSRIVQPVFSEVQILPLDPKGGSLGAYSFAKDEEGGLCVAAVTQEGMIRIFHRSYEENLFGDKEVSDESSDFDPGEGGEIQRLVIDSSRQNLYALRKDGVLQWWRLQENGTATKSLKLSMGEIRTTELLFGERTLVLGDAKGELKAFFPYRDQKTGDWYFSQVHQFPPMPGGIRSFTISKRNKGFAVGDDLGNVGLYYLTTEKRDWMGVLGDGPVQCLALGKKWDLLASATDTKAQIARVDDPHPESSLQIYFGKVWYEDAQEPSYVWQSTGGTDEFEPKLSLVPLIFGTLKGTFFALLFAVPFGVLGAMFVSQFLHASYQTWIKPIIEIMASLPSVILGFLGAIWLAPILEDHLIAFLMMPFFLPLFLIGSGFLGMHFPKRILRRFKAGSELFVFSLVLALGIWICFLVGPLVGSLFFEGDPVRWISDHWDMTYEQRNAIVIGIVMGFAVIPIIFSIAEDAFSNVPKNLVSGARALGANLWQTVSRVVFPTAAPGVFSAVMIGFGRAIGETMIVLMATGNTAIMDPSPFNGFRTLSANIATEISEAPVGGTLYRTLFFAGLLLFLITFVLNASADAVRHRLQKKVKNL
jgi:phosphate transport system permease protein